jgi:hypothetical protein
VQVLEAQAVVAHKLECQVLPEQQTKVLVVETVLVVEALQLVVVVVVLAQSVQMGQVQTLAVTVVLESVQTLRDRLF